MAMSDDELLQEISHHRHADHHQRRRDVPEEPALPRALQPVDRELVHRHLDPLHLPGDEANRRVRGHLHLRPA